MTTRIHIEGMTCGHCVAGVTRALQSVPGVESAQVSLENKSAHVEGTAGHQALLEAIKEEGYSASVDESSEVS